MSLDSAPQFFLNADARGGLVNGKQSYTVAQAADQIIRAMEATIQSKRVTYDFARLMDGATQVSTSRFGDEMIANME